MNMRLNSQSTALNMFLINQFEKEEHYRSVSQHLALTSAHHAPTVDTLPQPSKEPKKWANASINHNLKEFLKHNDLPDSLNVLNDHSVFEEAPILAEGWIVPTVALYRRLNPRRKAPYENQVHFAKFQCILSAVKFDKENPICLDRQGRILDGAYRVYVMAKLYEKGSYDKIYVRVYDFE